MVTTLQPQTPHTIKLEFADEPVTSFGGLVLAERAAARLGLWRTLENILPLRQGQFSWLSGIKAMVMGLLSGAQGTYATQALRQGEQTCVRALIEQVERAVLRPLKLHAPALVLADSLHGDEPTLKPLEAAHCRPWRVCPKPPGRRAGRAASWGGAPRGPASAGCKAKPGRPSVCWWGFRREGEMIEGQDDCEDGAQRRVRRVGKPRRKRDQKSPDSPAPEPAARPAAALSGPQDPCGMKAKEVQSGLTALSQPFAQTPLKDQGGSIFFGLSLSSRGWTAILRGRFYAGRVGDTDGSGRLHIRPGKAPWRLRLTA